MIDPISQIEIPVPPFATPERAIKRAERERAGQLRQIRFYPDGTNPWSLWENTETNPLPTPHDLGLSSQLAADLQAWYEDWSVNFRYDGPQDEDFSRRWLTEGARLAAQLREEVWDFAEIIPGGSGWDAKGGRWDY
ncbi:hypothetical protein [Lysinibacter sp. HNR]|uniref:hypothetical protein n=1 Tax=Lysinibacter sp. HNR TaxID=3031408 RepID=UPI00243571DB|nr:hypothetical protein [Lysinibacter sp. HNR]WGD37765.1 hypothetical protein FrondiHNR_02295 [Lysinibacter sp. HNR]